jgi:cis-3-alkyl-4-acyloxetan-2-one decarboxylase
MAGIGGFIREQREPLLHVSIDEAPAGAGRDGEVPTVVLVHGIASSSTTFDYVVPLIRDTHRVVAIDLLGFGLSPQPQDASYTLEEHVDALAHTLRHLGLRRFTLVGHSLGCLIASRYAATHRHALDRLVLVSPPVYQSPSEIGDPRVRAQVSGYLAAYRFFRENKDFTIGNAAWVTKLLPIEHVMEITEQNWTPFVKSLENCIETQTVISDLASVEVPIEVVYGTLDEFLVPGSVAILSRMKGVTTHPVHVNDHVIRRSMARVVATAIGAGPGE